MTIAVHAYLLWRFYWNRHNCLSNSNSSILGGIFKHKPHSCCNVEQRLQSIQVTQIYKCTYDKQCPALELSLLAGVFLPKNEPLSLYQ